MTTDYRDYKDFISTMDIIQQRIADCAKLYDHRLQGLQGLFFWQRIKTDDTDFTNY